MRVRIPLIIPRSTPSQSVFLPHNSPSSIMAHQSKIPFERFGKKSCPILEGDSSILNPSHLDQHVSNTKSAACKYIELRELPGQGRAYAKIAVEFKTSKHAVQQQVHQWENEAKWNKERASWFVYMKDKGEDDAASALVAMQSDSTHTPTAKEKVRRDHVDAYTRTGVAVTEGMSVRAASKSASEMYSLKSPLSRGSVTRSAKTLGLVSPGKAGRSTILPKSMEQSLVTDIIALRANKLVGRLSCLEQEKLVEDYSLILKNILVSKCYASCSKMEDPALFNKYVFDLV